MTQPDLAEESFPDLDDFEGKVRRIRELENGKVTRPQARNYLPLCETLNIDLPTIRKLKSMATDAKAQSNAEFSEIIEDRGSVETALSEASRLSRSELETLAERFGIDDIYQRSRPEMVDLLEQKAKEYAALKAEIDAIDGKLIHLSNLKNAAKEAIASANLEEVEELLSVVQEVELDEAAKTAELRAQNALLRGNIEQAYNVLVAISDSFAVVNETEPARRRDQYRELLYQHGRRYGGNSLQRAIDLIRPAISTMKKLGHEEEWASYTLNLAVALQVLGTRLPGTEGINMLSESIKHYRSILWVFENSDQPITYALAKKNLADALQELGIRTHGAQGVALLAEAVATYRTALSIFGEHNHVAAVAITIQDYAVALKNQGCRSTGTMSLELLSESIKAYHAAIHVLNEDDHPRRWAMAMQNLANALFEKGRRILGEKAETLFIEAVDAYRQARRVNTENDQPLEWAKNMQNYANVLREQGSRAVGEKAKILFEEAEQTYLAVLQIRTEDDHPVDWAITQANMAMLELELAGHDATSDPQSKLIKSAKHNAAALRILDPVTNALLYEEMLKVRVRINTALAAFE